MRFEGAVRAAFPGLLSANAVAAGQALEDDSGKDRLVAGHVGNGGPAAPPELMIDALGHVGVQQQRLGVHVDDAGKAGSAAACAIRSSISHARPSAPRHPCIASAATCR